jgi:rubredoxin
MEQQYLQPPQPAQQYAACPKCGITNAKKVRYTWWGGLLGPAILSQVKCESCGTSYNAKTGKDNTTGIIIYNVAAFVIVCAVLGVCALIITVLISSQNSSSSLTFFV